MLCQDQGHPDAETDTSRDGAAKHGRMMTTGFSIQSDINGY
jgi:hypothetical protein